MWRLPNAAFDVGEHVAEGPLRLVAVLAIVERDAMSFSVRAEADREDPPPLPLFLDYLPCRSSCHYGSLRLRLERTTRRGRQIACASCRRSVLRYRPRGVTAPPGHLTCPPTLLGNVTDSKELARTVRDLERARKARDDAIREASSKGMSERAIAKATGLSHQRVHQILRAR